VNAAAESPVAWWRPVLRVLVTLVVFVIVGLVIGLVVTIPGYILAVFHLSFDKFALGLYALTAYGLLLAYPLYLPVAIGLYVALRDELGGASLLEAAVVGAVVALIWAVLLQRIGGQPLFLGLVCGSTIVGTVVSWKLTRWVGRVI
jgi:hypothetical protein